MAGRTLAEVDAMVASLEQEIEKLNKGHKRVADSVLDMKKSLDRNNEMTSDVYEIMSNLRGFFKVVAMIGKGVIFVGKWLILPAIFVSVLVYAATHEGKFPEWWGSFMKLLSHW